MNGLHRPILPRQRAHSKADLTARRGSGLVRSPSGGRSGAIRCGGWLLGAGPHADDLGGRGTYAQIATSAGGARIGFVRPRKTTAAA